MGQKCSESTIPVLEINFEFTKPDDNINNFIMQTLGDFFFFNDLFQSNQFEVCSRLLSNLIVFTVKEKG